MIDNVATALVNRIKEAPEGSQMRGLLFFERRDLARAALKGLTSYFENHYNGDEQISSVIEDIERIINV